MIKLIMTATLLAATQVYRLERDTETETLQLVGADGVRRECCIMEPGVYAMLTGRVDQVWQSFNRTSDGRRELHGRLVGQEVSGTVKTEVYADGYRYHIPMQPKSPKRPSVTNAVKFTSKAVDRSISDRHRAWRDRIRKPNSSNGIREITIEHDATTGKDVVK